MSKTLEQQYNEILMNLGVDNHNDAIAEILSLRLAVLVDSDPQMQELKQYLSVKDAKDVIRETLTAKLAEMHVDYIALQRDYDRVVSSDKENLHQIVILTDELKELRQEKDNLISDLQCKLTEVKQAVQFAPSSAYWTNVLKEILGDEARNGINVLEKQLQELREKHDILKKLYMDQLS